MSLRYVRVEIRNMREHLSIVGAIKRSRERSEMTFAPLQAFSDG